MLVRRWLYKGILMGALGGAALAGVSGCMVGPNYRPPKTEMPPQWVEISTEDFSMQSKGIIHWWTLFDDSELNSLIDRAVRFNLDLNLAEARVREARALRGVVTADLYPDINAQADYTRSRRSENTVAGGAGAFGGAFAEQDLYDASFDSIWELDIFGRTRRAVEAAEADIGASIYNYQDVMVTVVSEVARNYMVVRGSQRRIEIAYQNIERQKQSVELTRARFEAGLGSKLEVAQAEGLLASTQAQIPIMQTTLRQAIYSLSVLLGREPDALLKELSRPEPLPAPPVEVPVGLPSELLRRRPDIRSAERQLAAATARIGVAVADLFPSFSLTGVLGLQSTSFSDLFATGSRYWSAGPTVVWPIFQGGRIRSNIRVQDARQAQALVFYRQTVLTALQDVENALVAYSRQQLRYRFLLETVDADRRAVDISKELYKQGLVDFLNVLSSETSLYQSEEQLVLSEQALLTDLVALYKALGGGWELAPAVIGEEEIAPRLIDYERTALPGAPTEGDKP